MRYGFDSTSSSVEPNFWNYPDIKFYHCVSKGGLVFLQDSRHRFLTWNSSGLFQNFTSHRGHTVGFSISRGGTRCWRDLTCSVWFTAEVWPPVAGLSHMRPNRLIITRGQRCFQPCNWICICQSFRKLLAWLKPSLGSFADSELRMWDASKAEMKQTDKFGWTGGGGDRRPFFRVWLEWGPYAAENKIAVQRVFSL